MATTKRMLGVHLSEPEPEHEFVKALAAKDGESVSVLFRQWLRAQAKKHGLLQA